MFIFVKSAVNHFRRRSNIRNTWGSLKFLDGGQFSTIFIIGKTDDVYKQALVNEEIARFSDILQMDISDDYA